MMDFILEALRNIPASTVSYAEWTKIGMALSHEGYPCSVWDSWSQNDSRYIPGECEKKWKTFGDTNNPVTGGTIIQIAKDNGWVLPSKNTPMDWADTISYDGDDQVTADKNKLPKWSSTDQLLRYIKAVFDENDIVAYVVHFYAGKNGKWMPGDKGVFTRTAADLIASLQEHPDDITETIGNWTKEAGARISFNPLDGKGIKHENVTAFRYALVEFDDIDISEQEKIVRKLRLPIAALILSGRRSIHAIVHIDATDADEYKDRVNSLFNYLKQHGYPVDEQNKNPNRMTRMPGVSRDGKKQELIDTNIGTRSWREWREFILTPDDGLPLIVNLDDYINDLPPQPEELIQGILRHGHKLLIAAASKAGKSFLIMELCIAVAEGTKWLNFQCRQGKVLYINLEIDSASVYHRFADIYNAMGITPTNANNIEIWNLRGKSVPLTELIDTLIRRIKHKHYDAVVLDPIYKVITGDENSASEMGKFCNLLDRICNEVGSSVIYAHHHSKGAQGGKRAADRASGSGVFHRDADALLDIIELEVPKEVKQENPNITAWRMESSLREFSNITPLNFYFDYPIHYIDVDGDLEQCHPLGSMEANLNKSPNRTSKKERMTELDEAYNACVCDGKPVKLLDMAQKSKHGERSLRRYIQESNGKYVIQNGYVEKHDDK